MQKKSKPIPKSALLVRVVIIVLSSNILLLGLVNTFSPNPSEFSCSQPSENPSHIYFKLPAILKTRFEIGKEVVIVEPATSIQVKATLWEERLGEFSQNFSHELSNNTEHPRHMYIVSTNKDDLPTLYRMKKVEILPGPLHESLLHQKVTSKNKKRKNYEISY